MLNSQLQPARVSKAALLTQLLRQPQPVSHRLQLDVSLGQRLTRALQVVQHGIKRGFDLLASLVGLLMISPLLLLIALLIKLTSPGPVLYTSERIGKDNQPFGMYKFRTMVVNADAQRDALRQAANLEGQLFKLENDPRVTALGRILRATSLDELPQLLNVVRGEMSLVGPRPLPPDESAMFKAPYTVRFQVFPGITGIWQVSGRSNISFDRLCQLEFQYVTRWNLLSDLRILLQTVPAVLKSRGAY